MNNGINLMKLKDFAKALNVPVNGLKKWKSKGCIPAECFITIGHTQFVKLDKFAEFTAEKGKKDGSISTC